MMALDIGRGRPSCSALLGPRRLQPLHPGLVLCSGRRDLLRNDAGDLFLNINSTWNDGADNDDENKNGDENNEFSEDDDDDRDDNDNDRKTQLMKRSRCSCSGRCQWCEEFRKCLKTLQRQS